MTTCASTAFDMDGIERQCQRPAGHAVDDDLTCYGAWGRGHGARIYMEGIVVGTLMWNAAGEGKGFLGPLRRAAS